MSKQQVQVNRNNSNTTTTPVTTVKSDSIFIKPAVLLSEQHKNLSSKKVTKSQSNIHDIAATTSVKNTTKAADVKMEAKGVISENMNKWHAGGLVEDPTWLNILASTFYN